MDVLVKVLIQIQCRPHKKSNDLVHRAKKTSPRTHREAQTPCTANRVLSKEQCRKDGNMGNSVYVTLTATRHPGVGTNLDTQTSRRTQK